MRNKEMFVKTIALAKRIEACIHAMEEIGIRVADADGLLPDTYSEIFSYLYDNAISYLGLHFKSEDAKIKIAGVPTDITITYVVSEDEEFRMTEDDFYDAYYYQMVYGDLKPEKVWEEICGK